MRARIEETFDIASRGTVAVVAEVSDLPVGKALKATVTRSDGTRVEATAYKEWLLRRNPTPVEKEAYLMVGLSKADMPVGSALEIVVPP